MADAYARMSRRVGGVTVHQGCGLTNALTGITEAAKSRTPISSSPPRRPSRGRTSASISPRWPGRSARCRAGTRRRGAAPTRPRAVATAVQQRRTVLLNLPLDVQTAGRDLIAAAPAARRCRRRRPRRRPATSKRSPTPCAAPPSGVHRRSRRARAGRPRRWAAGRPMRRAARHLGRRPRGCSPATRGRSDVSGGFASPLAAELIGGADLVVGWGCTLNMWTMRHGRLIAPGATVVQVDVDADALGAHRPVDLGVLGDVGDGRAAVRRPWRRRPARPGYRTAERARADRAPRCAGGTCRTTSRRPATRIDPRTLIDRASTTCCRPSGWWPSTRATSWATRRMFLSRARRVRVLLHPGVPVDRAGPGHRDRRGAGAAGPATGGGPRRRRLPDGGRRTGDRRAAGPADGRGRLQRRGLRRRGAPLRPARPPAGHGTFPGDRPRRDRSRLRLRRGHRPRPRGPDGGGRVAGRPARPPAADRREGDPRAAASWWLEEAFRGH